MVLFSRTIHEISGLILNQVGTDRVKTVEPNRFGFTLKIRLSQICPSSNNACYKIRHQLMQTFSHLLKDRLDELPGKSHQSHISGVAFYCAQKDSRGAYVLYKRGY